MKMIQKFEFHAESREERLPNFDSDFPYIMSCAELDKYIGQFVPWHWHKAVELFLCKVIKCFINEWERGIEHGE
ncbi:hypothetical protein [Sporofaciens musculi]|mgnify:FL=1|jgi:hypothetical protein